MTKHLFLFAIFMASFDSLLSQEDSRIDHTQLKREGMHVKADLVYSKYANLENEITAKLIKKQIPVTFPEYNQSKETIDQYKQRISEWYLNNTELLVPEFRTELIEQKQLKDSK